jgi:hypothetical protein
LPGAVARPRAGRPPRQHDPGTAAVFLTALIEDLRSIQAPQAVIEPLVELLEELDALLAAEHPRAATVQKLTAKTRERLETFVNAGPEPDTGSGKKGSARGRSFWK